MRFSLRSKMSRICTVVTIVIAVSAFMLSGPLFRAAATHAAASSQQHDVRQGTIAPAATVNLSKFSAVNGATLSPKHLSKALRHFQPAGTAGQEPTALNSSSEEPPVGALLHNFNGTSSLDSAVTNFGAEFEPPDQGLCVGNGLVLEPVNSALRIYRPDGSTVIGPLNVNDLFAEGPKEFTSDPRCQFDKTTNRWFAIILFISADNTSARTDIAVSNSGDPTQDWTVYHLDATDNGMNGELNNPGCPCFGDQPLLGIDSSNLYISTNEFSIVGPQFNGAQIYALSKSQLIARTHSVHFVDFENLRIGGAQATSVQPAITYGQANAEYFLNSLDPNGTGDNRLGVWAMSNRDAVSAGGIPTLSKIVISSEKYGVPPPALQKGASSTIDSGDDRMQQVQFINGELWGALDTKVKPEGDTQVRAGIAWFRVRPQLAGSVMGSATIVNQGYVALAGNYLLYPAIQANTEGIATIVLSLTGPNYFPSAGYVVMHEGQNAFGKVRIAAPGTGPYAPTSTRWGDYSWITLSPTDNTFWMATEYIPPMSSQTPDRLQNWGTRVMDVNGDD